MAQGERNIKLNASERGEYLECSETNIRAALNINSRVYTGATLSPLLINQRTFSVLQIAPSNYQAITNVFCSLRAAGLILTRRGSAVC